MSDPLFEHRFWLQIMGDHGRMLRDVTSPIETADVAQLTEFIERFDQLLAEARQPQAQTLLQELNRRAEQAVLELRDYKLDLLGRLILGKVKIGFTPSFLNHMVNELEEYLRILKALNAGEPVPIYHPLHHDLLWLQDAFGHAAGIKSDLDLTENKLSERSKGFEKQFEALYIKAVEMAGFMRTALQDFPAFRRFHGEIDLEMRCFMHFLQELEQMQLDASSLDRISPLIPDHMLREECYYLTKLAELGRVAPPGCDPAKPRIEA